MHLAVLRHMVFHNFCVTPGIFVAMNGPFRPATGLLGLVAGAPGTNSDLPTNSRQTQRPQSVVGALAVMRSCHDTREVMRLVMNCDVVWQSWSFVRWFMTVMTRMSHFGPYRDYCHHHHQGMWRHCDIQPSPTLNTQAVITESSLTKHPSLLSLNLFVILLPLYIFIIKIPRPLSWPQALIPIRFKFHGHLNWVILHLLNHSRGFYFFAYFVGVHQLGWTSGSSIQTCHKVDVNVSKSLNSTPRKEGRAHYIFHLSFNHI